MAGDQTNNRPLEVKSVYYELISVGLKTVSNTVAARRMTVKQMNALNAELAKTSSLRWAPTFFVDVLGFKRPAQVVSPAACGNNARFCPSHAAMI